MLNGSALRTNPLAGLAEDLDVDDPQLHARLPSLRARRARLPLALTALVDASLKPDPAARRTVGEALGTLYALT